MKELIILSIDYGEKKLGIALKEKGVLQVKPLQNLKNEGDTSGKVVALAKQYNVNLIVLGYPVRPNGKKSEITYKVEAFNKALQNSLPQSIKTELHDETLTTQEALYLLKLKHKSEQFIELNKHMLAASLILERFLERKEQP